MNKLDNLSENQLAKKFYRTSEWIALRNLVMKTKNTGCCANCKVEFSFKKWCEPAVDHILPLKLHPELALDIDNLQILCSGCNYKKGSKVGTEAGVALANARTERNNVAQPDDDDYCFETSRQQILKEIEKQAKPPSPEKIKCNKKNNNKNRKKQLKIEARLKNAKDNNPSPASQWLPKHLRNSYAQVNYDSINYNVDQ